MQTFIICGYGIPEDIHKDTNYTTYLNLVFNEMYEKAANKEAVIIPCGGPTKCELPYNETEADVISDYLESLMKRSETLKQTSGWTIVLEDRSLSTLENLIYAKEIMVEKELNEDVVIFCEKTRTLRVQAFANHLFGENTTVNPIDFDISKNRYLDPSVLDQKEKLGLQEGLWTLESKERIDKHHEFFQKKFEFLRRRQSEGLSHVDAVGEWFKNEKEIIHTLMPDHPFFRELGDE